VVLTESCVSKTMDAAERPTLWDIPEIQTFPTVMGPSTTSLAATSAKQDRPRGLSTEGDGCTVGDA
jgi:hypothetical protein